MSEQSPYGSGRPSDDTSDEEAGAGVRADRPIDPSLAETASSYGAPADIDIEVDQDLAGDGQREDDLDGEP